ncbi:MAG: hypothetical protein AAF193_02420 [Bacteroidota bacterium]
MKYVLSLVAMMIVATSFSQKDVTTAYNLNKEGKYLEAAEYIDRAITQEKAGAKEKTWRYRGDIYMNISQDSTLLIQKPNAINTSGGRVREGALRHDQHFRRHKGVKGFDGGRVESKACCGGSQSIRKVG